MSDDNDGQGDEEPDDDSEETFDEFYREQRNAAMAQQPDAMLQFLVRVIADADISLHVALWVHGQVVSGEMVSAAAWYGEMAHQFERSEAAIGIEAGEGMGGALREMERYAAVAAATPRDDKEPILYVHLINATAIDGVNRINGHWRGRLSSVDGWTLGSYGSEPPA
jgi:hypothetical protein